MPGNARCVVAGLAYHVTPEELTSLRLLRRCTYAGRPYGEEEFVASPESRFHRQWRRWGFEKGSAASRFLTGVPAISNFILNLRRS